MTTLKLKTQEEAWRESVDTEIVGLMEEMLAQAKNGEFDGIAIAASRKDGQTFHSWSSSSDFARLAGAISRLQYRLMLKQDD